MKLRPLIINRFLTQRLTLTIRKFQGRNLRHKAITFTFDCNIFTNITARNGLSLNSKLRK